MKAIGVVGSPRKNGNTEILTEYALETIAEEGLDTELIWDSLCPVQLTGISPLVVKRGR